MTSKKNKIKPNSSTKTRFRDRYKAFKIVGKDGKIESVEDSSSGEPARVESIKVISKNSRNAWLRLGFGVYPKIYKKILSSSTYRLTKSKSKQNIDPNRPWPNPKKRGSNE